MIHRSARSSRGRHVPQLAALAVLAVASGCSGFEGGSEDGASSTASHAASSGAGGGTQTSSASGTSTSVSGGDSGGGGAATTGVGGIGGEGGTSTATTSGAAGGDEGGEGGEGGTASTSSGGGGGGEVCGLANALGQACGRYHNDCGNGCMTLTDANNCGACGHACQGAICEDAVCTPTIVVTAPTTSIARDFEVDDQYVYWIGQEDFRNQFGILRAPSGGGSPADYEEVVPPTTPLYVYDIAVDDTNLYWVEKTVQPPNAASLIMAEKDGSNPVTIDAWDGVWVLEVDDDAVYAVTGYDPPRTLNRIPKGGGEPIPLATGVMINHVAPMGEYVYFTSGATPSAAWEILRVPKSGGSVEPVASGINGIPWELAVAGCAVYWNTWGAGQQPWNVWRATTPGAGEIIRDFGSGDLHVDGVNLYVGNQVNSLNVLERMNLDGSEVVDWAFGNMEVTTLRTDDLYLYFNDQDTNVIRRTPKYMQ
jgi:hypothetical protein